MDNANKTAESIVTDAFNGLYAVPELQRDFVWSPRQVVQFADSLSKNFPVGGILTWKSNTVQRGDDQTPAQMKSWIIDGQQRTTALCTLFRKRPAWWDDGWNDHLTKFDVRLDVGAENISFVVRKSANSNRYIRVSTILETKGFYTLAKQTVDDGSAFSKDVDEVAERLQQVAANLKGSTLPVVEMGDNVDLEDVAEIFRRLNSSGTRAQQADIYLGIVAANNPNWVNQHFRRFMSDLHEDRFEIEPAFLFRTFSAIGSGRTRFKEVPQEFWKHIDTTAWNNTKKALLSVCQGFREFGIINSDLALSLNAVVTGAIYRAQFPNGPFGPFLAWMLFAIKDGFFGGPTETRLDRVIGVIRNADDRNKAISDLYRLSDLSSDNKAPFKPDDFRDTPSNRNSLERLMIYLLAFKNNAEDWGTDGYHIRAEAQSVQYRPEWHHIFPRKWLRDNVPGIQPDKVNTVANMAIISSQANKKIAASEPKKYVTDLKLASRGLLDQQAIPDPTSTSPKQYLSWVDKRAERLAKEANEYLAALRSEK